MSRTRDYAGKRSGSRQPVGKRPSRPVRGAAAAGRAGWSTPSFSAGAVFGAALVLLAGWVPSALEQVSAASVNQPNPEAAENSTESVDFDFEFEELLANDTVVADPSAYPADFPDENPSASRPVYLIQAISLRSAGKAADLAGELNGLGLEARWERVELSSGTWYRVVVGPFTSRRDADRAMTALRERNMTPRLSKLG